MEGNKAQAGVPVPPQSRKYGFFNKLLDGNVGTMARLARTSGAALRPRLNLGTEQMRTTPQGNWRILSISYAKTGRGDSTSKWLSLISLEVCRSFLGGTQGGLSMIYGISLRKTGWLTKMAACRISWVVRPLRRVAARLLQGSSLREGPTNDWGTRAEKRAALL